MIKATLTLRNHTMCLVVKGHADSAEVGKDLICASASMITYELAQVVKNKGGLLTKAPKLKLESGDTEIKATAKPEHYGELYVSFTDCIVGFNLLARNYPKYVAVPKIIGNVPNTERNKEDSSTNGQIKTEGETSHE